MRPYQNIFPSPQPFLPRAEAVGTKLKNAPSDDLQSPTNLLDPMGWIDPSTLSFRELTGSAKRYVACLFHDVVSLLS